MSCLDSVWNKEAFLLCLAVKKLYNKIAVNESIFVGNKTRKLRRRKETVVESNLWWTLSTHAPPVAVVEKWR